MLLLEDDLAIASFVAEALIQAGFRVDHVRMGEQALALAGAAEFDAAVVDIMLPRIDGLSVLEQLRGNGNQLPILILSAKSGVDDRIRGLRKGGDDYLPKPFSVAELIARVQALIRRAQSPVSSPETLQALGVELNLLSRRASRNGDPLDLQPKVFMLLEYFLRNPNIVLTKSIILERVWDYDFNPQTNVVDVLVSRLRAKVDRPYGTPLIHTVRGFGYVFRDTEQSSSALACAWRFSTRSCFCAHRWYYWPSPTRSRRSP